MLLVLILELAFEFVLGLEFGLVLSSQIGRLLKPRLAIGLGRHLQGVRVNRHPMHLFLHLVRFPRGQLEEEVKQAGLVPKGESLQMSPVVQSHLPEKKKKKRI